MNRKIQSLLILRGVKQREIAKTLKVTDQIVSQVIYGYRTSQRIRQTIADALGMQVEQLWPEKSRRRAA